MKQKRIEDTLYVFDVTPYTITEDRDASIIKVQQETYEGFVNQNPDIASKIVKYNYHMFTVNKQEWSDYVDEPDPEPETYIVTYDAGEDDNNPQVTVTFKSPNPQSEAYLNGTGLDDISEDWFNIVSDRLNHLTDEGEDAVISANSGDLKLFFDSESTNNICLGTSSENVYIWIGKETSTEGTVSIVSAPNDQNIPTSALNFVATFDNPWYIKNQNITLTDNEYAQYVRTDVGPYPVGQECFIIPTQDAPNNLTATVVNDTTSESLSLEEQEDTDTGKTTWMFIMPDAPVTITIGVQA